MKKKISDSKELAWRIRRDIIKMTHDAKASHIGSALSCVDIIAVLYARIMNYDIGNPKLDTRDRIILSKGHAGTAIYAALAEEGFFDVDELKTYGMNGSKLSGHISHRDVPGIEISTGSLGHGLSIGAGMAMAGKMNKKAYKVYVILGDGECDEGAIWECALFANSYKLDNLVTIIDHNKMQGLGECEKIIKLTPLEEKWKAFGWNIISVDGHNFDKLEKAFKSIENVKDKPTVIVANTIKGKGVSFMENNNVWHYKNPGDEEYQKAMQELEETR